MKYQTAESVTLGHPDKLSDYIADRILDECLKQDPESRVACEVMLSHEVMMVAGEITTKAKVDYQQIAENAIKEAGYEPPESFVDDIVEQSPDINQAVNEDQSKAQGAGDQGIMYGYSTSETFDCLPLATSLAHRLTEQMMKAMKTAPIKLGPDGKSQVTVAYTADGKYSHVASVLVSIQHGEDVDDATVQKEVKKLVIDPVLEDFITEQTEVIINPSGRFVLGGFKADTGLTGRKLMVDTYGGLAKHGGGALSGKDPSKVDRSGAYMARYIANAIVAANLAEKCEVSLAYAIGRAEPTMVNVDTFKTWNYAPDRFIASAVRKTFDITPAGIIKTLKLKETRYASAAAHGHFNCHEDGTQFPWENVDTDTIVRLQYNLREALDDDTSN